MSAPDTCKYCHCTAEEPCPGGCSWNDATRTICTTCARLEAIAGSFLGVIADHVAPGLTLEGLPLDVQRRLLGSCRALEDRWTAAVGDQLHDDALEALEGAREYDVIARLVASTGRARDGESVSETLERLLGPVPVLPYRGRPS